VKIGLPKRNAVSGRGILSRRGRTGLLPTCLLTILGMGCGGPEGRPIEVEIPAGSAFEVVVDTLVSRGIVDSPGPFSLFARLQGADREIRAGRYLLRRGERWSEILDDLTAGRMVTEALTIPEGYRLKQMAGPISTITGTDSLDVLERLSDSTATERWKVPGPFLEGYLFPDTYRFAPGVPVRVVIATMIDRYRELWTAERRALRDSLGMSEKEAVTLASIIQAEARQEEEMPRISSVYHGRLERGMLLQADPTVVYALGGHRERLLFAAIDSVADSPYNTYTHPGLPPGPIGAPGEAALEAALRPVDEPFLYFVARPDGTHIFSRTLAEHNRAVQRARRDRRERGGER